MRSLTTLTLALLLALAVPALAQQSATYRVELRFTLPTAPGAQVIKHVVVVGDGLTQEEADVRAAVANKVLFGISGAYAQQKPPRGWAPFAAGVHVAPAP